MLSQQCRCATDGIGWSQKRDWSGRRLVTGETRWGLVRKQGNVEYEVDGLERVA